MNLNEAWDPGYMFPMKTLGQNFSKQKKILKRIQIQEKKKGGRGQGAKESFKTYNQLGWPLHQL